MSYQASRHASAGSMRPSGGEGLKARMQGLDRFIPAARAPDVLAWPFSPDFLLRPES